jgi:hypothetical protein
MTGINYVPDVITNNATNSQITVMNSAPICTSDGLGAYPPATTVSFAADAAMLNDNDVVMDPITNPPISYRSSPQVAATEAGAEITVNTLYSLYSLPRVSASNATSVATVEEYVDFHCENTTVNSTGTLNLTDRINIRLKDDSRFDNQIGISSAIIEGPGNRFIDHTGGAESHHTGDFYVHSLMAADVVKVDNELVLGNHRTKMVDGIMYQLDHARGKWLSVYRQTWTWGVNTGADQAASVWLTGYGTATDGAGQVAAPMLRDATITGISYGAHDVQVAPLEFQGYSVESGDTAGQIDKLWEDHFLPNLGDDTTTFVAYDGLDIDIDQGLGLTVKTLVSGGVTYHDPCALIEIAWRIDA